MTTQQKEDLAHIVMSVIQIQSAIHTLDKIVGTNEYKFLKKKQYNDFIERTNKFLREQEFDQYTMTDIFGKIDQVQNFVDCVAEFDKLAESIQINFAPEK